MAELSGKARISNFDIHAGAVGRHRQPGDFLHRGKAGIHFFKTTLYLAQAGNFDSTFFLRRGYGRCLRCAFGLDKRVDNLVCLQTAANIQRIQVIDCHKRSASSGCSLISLTTWNCKIYAVTDKGGVKLAYSY